MTEWTGILTMKINNLWYLLKEGIRGIFLHGFMSFAAICVTVACLLIVGSFSALTYNLNLTIQDLNKTNEVMVYVDETLSDAEARSVGTKINWVENIANQEFISREQALKDFIADHPETDAFEGTSADTFRHRFSVTLKNNRLLDETKEDLMAVPGVVKVRASEELAAGFVMMQEVVELVSLVIIAALLIVSLVIISNTVKLAVYDRRNEIAVELSKALETGQSDLSKHIPEYLGRFALWLTPRELDEVIDQMETLLSSSSSNVVSGALNTVGSILESYARMERMGVEGGNIGSAMKDVEDIMDKLVLGFEKQLDALFDSEALDVTTDVSVLENMMTMEGLSDLDPFGAASRRDAGETWTKQ